jgi:hypothetical protein
MADFLNKKATPLNGEDFKLKDHFTMRDFVVTDKGDPFVRHDPLLRVAKAVLGVKGKKVQVFQCPDKGNEWSATVAVNYEFADGISFSATADYRKSSSKGGFDLYTTAMAETRASARALRFALGVEICSADEIADIDSMGEVDQDEPIEENQMIVLKNKYMKQHGITLETVQEIVPGVVFLEDLTKSQASELFKKLNTKINRKKK